MRIAALLAATLVLAGCAVGGTTKTATVTTTRTVTTKPGPMRETENARYFGTPVSITKVDAKRYLLVLRPQFFLVGVTANVAAAAEQGTACAPLSCPGVTDDRLVVPAGSRKLTFVLPAKTQGTVLANAPGGFEVSTVSASDLAGIVSGATNEPKLVEPLDSGLWLSVDVDKVTSFAQQFQP